MPSTYFAVASCASASWCASVCCFGAADALVTATTATAAAAIRMKLRMVPPSVGFIPSTVRRKPSGAHGGNGLRCPHGATYLSGCLAPRLHAAARGVGVLELERVVVAVDRLVVRRRAAARQRAPRPCALVAVLVALPVVPGVAELVRDRLVVLVRHDVEDGVSR